MEYILNNPIAERETKTVYKDDGKLMSLIPSVYNKRHGFSVVNDKNKTVIVFPGLIIEHLNQ